MNVLRFRIKVFGAILVLVAGCGWLYGRAAQQKHSRPAIGNLFLSVAGNPSPIGLVTFNPNVVLVNTPTAVTITAQFSGPFISSSATVVKASSVGSTVLAPLHDDGVSGDLVPGDGIYSATVILTEKMPGDTVLQVSIAQPNLLKRVLSNPLHVTVQGLNLSGLLSSTPLVVQGKILTTTSYKTDSRLYTDVTFSPTRLIKGSASPTFVVHLGGGTVAGTTQMGPISARIEVGTELILFLDGPDSVGRMYIPDGPLGLFVVVRSQSTALAVVDPAYKSSELNFPLDSTLLTLFDQSNTNQLSVDELITAIQNND